MDLTYLLLGLAIVALWCPSLRVARATVAPWPLLLAAAVASGLAGGVLSWPALFPLVALTSLAWFESRSRLYSTSALACEPPRVAMLRGVGAAAAGVIALTLALHLLPGFHNPPLLAAVSISPDAAPMTQCLNFDKGAAGLLLLAYCRRSRGANDVRRAAPATLTAILVAPAVLLGIALAVGYVRPDPKFPPFAVAFLATNLLFVCVAEEAFFRGLLQARLARILPASTTGRAASAVVSALLFGLAHVAGGATAAALASAAGLAYAAVYAVTGRIEPAILTHFAVNAVHFLGFTYPYLIR